MPWTFSHPAAIVPISRLSKNKLPLIPLAIGSCSPDFGYYLNEWVLAARTHDFISSLTTILPVCLVMFAVIILLRDAILFLLPKRLSKVIEIHIPSVGIPNLQTVFFTILAIIVGIYSHILWDSFTHNPNYFKDWWPFINAKITLNAFEIRLYKLLQHTSTIVGISLIFYWTYKQVQKQDSTKENNWRWIFWISLVVIAGISSIWIYATGYPIKLSELNHFLFINAINSANIIVVSLLCIMVVLQIYFTFSKKR